MILYQLFDILQLYFLNNNLIILVIILSYFKIKLINKKYNKRIIVFYQLIAFLTFIKLFLIMYSKYIKIFFTLKIKLLNIFYFNFNKFIYYIF